MDQTPGVVLHRGSGDPKQNFKNWPHCNVCNKPVEQIRVDTPVREFWGGLLEPVKVVPDIVLTGEIILTINCHGETWQTSTWKAL